MNQYKEELASVHAPKDLILKTKAAIKVEEERLKEERINEELIKEEQLKAEQPKETQVVNITAARQKAQRNKLMISIAAAILLLAGAGILFLITTPKTGQIGQLAGDGKKKNEISVIEETSLFKVEQFEEGTEIDFDQEKLVEFKNCEEKVYENITYRTSSAEEGMKVYVVSDNKSYIFKFESTNIELILPIIADYLAK